MMYSTFAVSFLISIKRQALFLCRVALVTLVWSQGLSAQVPMHGAHGNAPASAPAPAQIYQQYCSVCHGDQGNGRSRASGSMQPPPLDFTRASAAELTRERMIGSVRDGRKGTAMAPWSSQLDEAQVEALVDFIRSQFMVLRDDGLSGAGIYSRNCSVCHGDDGRGAVWASSSLRTRPRDFTAPRAARELSRERMIQSASFGRADTPMPGFATQLSAAQIEAVVDFIRLRFMAGAAPVPASASAHDDRHSEHGHGLARAAGANAQRNAEAFPAGLAGDFRRGELLYRQNCVACHGRKGNGQGPRAYFILPKPRDFTHMAARQSLNRAHLFAAISSGTVGSEMPAWEKVLDVQSIADVAEYVYQQFVIGNSASASQ